MWKIRDIKDIPEKYFIVEKKRFSGQKVLFTELIDNSYMTRQFFKNCESIVSVANKVITEIKYPLMNGNKPTDFHYYQAFKKPWFGCQKCFRNDFDYWQFAWETAWLGMGDCEDSSILCGAGYEILRNKMIEICLYSPCECPYIDYYIVLGEVYYEDEFLGYHAWVIVKDISDKWRLVETTLDTPYKDLSDIPRINFETNTWKIEELTYAGHIIINKRKYGEWIEEGIIMKCEKIDFGKWKEIGRKEKENVKKYKYIRKAYKKLGKDTKVKV